LAHFNASPLVAKYKIIIFTCRFQRAFTQLNAMNKSAESQNQAWWEKPNRVLLVNLREGDEPKINAQALVDDMKNYDASAFCISGGGIVAFYQTQIPDHRLSSGLMGRDLLAEIIPLAHASGLKVLARIDPSCAPMALAEKNPEWFSRDEKGQFREVSEHYVTCPNAQYYHRRIVDIAIEMIQRYNADGIWNNQGKFAAWDTDTCFCKTCKDLFKFDTGLDLPLKEDWQSKPWRVYNQWRYEKIAVWVKTMHTAIHQAKADAVFIAATQLSESLETIQPGGWDIDYWIEHQDVLTFECQRRNTAPWWPGIQAKYLSSIAKDKPKWMTVSYFYPWWRLYAAPEEENRPWIAQQFANGVSSWLHINGASSEIFDRRGYAPMQDVFQRLGRWQGYFDQATSCAQVAIVYSRFSQDNYGQDKPYARYVDAVRGYYMALQEAHIPFDVLSDKFLHHETLKKYQVVVLPNTACLTQSALDALIDFTNQGGTLVATFESGMYDEMGEKRSRGGLADIFKVKNTKTLTQLKSSYGQIQEPRHPIFLGIENTDLIPNDGSMVDCELTTPTPSPLTLIPPVTAHSGATISIPEYSGNFTPTTKPMFISQQYGLGQGLWFSNQMDMLFYHYGFPDLGKMLANAVAMGLGERRDLEVIASNFVDVTSMSQNQRRLVHLINLPVGKSLNTGWRHPGGNLIAQTNIVVRVKLAAHQTLKEVRLASNESLLQVRHHQAWHEVVIPQLDDHDIVIFEFVKI